MKEKKSNSKSVRMTDTVLNIVDALDGKSFNQKFEDLVLHCMKELPDIEKQIEYKKSRLEQVNTEIRERESILRKLDQIQREVNYLVNSVVPKEDR